LNLTPGSIYS
jgi:hypothetical protein